MPYGVHTTDTKHHLKTRAVGIFVVVDYEIFMRQSAYKTAEIDLVKNRTNRSAFWEVKELMKLNSVDRNHGYLNFISQRMYKQ